MALAISHGWQCPSSDTSSLQQWTSSSTMRQERRYLTPEYKETLALRRQLHEAANQLKWGTDHAETATSNPDAALAAASGDATDANGSKSSESSSVPATNEIRRVDCIRTSFIRRLYGNVWLMLGNCVADPLCPFSA